MSVSEYLRHHDESWLELQQQSPQLLSYEDRTLYTTWNLSYTYIRNEDEAAARLLELWSYLDYQDLWFGLLKAGGNDEAPAWFLDIIRTELNFQGLMAKLQKHALVERLTGSNGYAMHACVHSWVKAIVRKDIEEPKLELVLNCIGNSVPVDIALGDWQVKQRLLPHAEKGLYMIEVLCEKKASSENLKIYIFKFLASLGILYRAHRKFSESESLFLWALSCCEKAFGPDNIWALKIINNLGNLYSNQSRLQEAESMYKRALSGYEKAFGQDNTLAITTMNNLGTLYSNQERLLEAESMYQQALPRYENSLGSDYISTLDTIRKIGILYRKQGRLQEAESMLQRALSGYEKAFGASCIPALDTMNSLGTLYVKRDRLPEAKSIFQRALAGYKKDPCRRTAGLANTSYNIGLLYQEEQKFEKAQEHFKEAHQNYAEVLGSENPETLDALNMMNECRDLQLAAANLQD